MKQWIPTVGDLVTINQEDSMHDIPVYRIKRLSNEINGMREGTVSLVRLVHTDLYASFLSFYEIGKIIGGMQDLYPNLEVLYILIDQFMKEKFPLYDWVYEEKETFSTFLTDLHPIGMTYWNLTQEEK